MSNLISFTVYDIGTSSVDGTYQAEEGMTWAEWMDSKYDTTLSYSNDGRVYYAPGGGGFPLHDNEMCDGYGVSVDSVIMADATYYIRSAGDVGGSN